MLLSSLYSEARSSMIAFVCIIICLLFHINPLKLPIISCSKNPKKKINGECTREAIKVLNSK